MVCLQCHQGLGVWLAGGFLAAVLGNSQSRSGEDAARLVMRRVPTEQPRRRARCQSRDRCTRNTAAGGKVLLFFFNNLFCERSDVVGGRNFRLALGFVQLTV